jgi:hypothetical protein
MDLEKWATTMLSRLSQWALDPWWVSLRVWVLVCDQLGEEKKEKSRSLSEQKGPLHASGRQVLRWFRRERARFPTYGQGKAESNHVHLLVWYTILSLGAGVSRAWLLCYRKYAQRDGCHPLKRTQFMVPAVAFSFCSTRIFVRSWLNKIN